MGVHKNLYDHIHTNPDGSYRTVFAYIASLPPEDRRAIEEAGKKLKLEWVWDDDGEGHYEYTRIPGA